jgi:hypothetical protein
MAYIKLRGYLHKSIRRGGRVTTRYLGRGDIGAGLAEVDDILRERRLAERRERAEAEERAVELYDRERSRGLAVRRLVAVVLAPLGIVRYQRQRTWRRRSMKATTPARRGEPKPPSPKQVRALVKRVRAGDPDALVDLAELAKLHPRLVAETTTTDLARCARMFLAELLASKTRDKAAEVAVEARLDLLEAELAATSRGPASRLVAAAVTHSGAEYWALTAAAARVLGKMTTGDLRRQGAALSRYLSALRTFARIRAIEGEA